MVQTTGAGHSSDTMKAQRQVVQRQLLKSWTCWSLLPLWVMIPAELPAADIDYNRNVRPILSDNCYPCHGPDANTRKADLRLDIEDGAFRTRNGVAVIVRGKSAESEFVRRISASDDDRMPPVNSNRSLSA